MGKKKKRGKKPSKMKRQNLVIGAKSSKPAGKKVTKNKDNVINELQTTPFNPSMHNLSFESHEKPEPGEIFFQQGVDAFNNKDYKQAERKFVQSLEANPGKTIIHIWLASLYKETDQIQSAELHAAKAMKNGLKEEALLTFGEIALKKNDVTKAAHFFEKCLFEFPQCAAASHNLGIALWRRGRRLDAMAHFDKAVETEPENSSFANTRIQARDYIRKYPTISLCMMVRDEEKNLSRCLESVEGAVDEIIVVDTGSTDKTIDIAREYGVRLYEHPWFNDFSGMRNITIGYAQGDWVLILDADEELEFEDKDLLRSAAQETAVNGVMVTVHNYMGDKTRDFKGNSIRLFKNDGKIHYDGIVHNILKIDAPFRESNIRVHHYGYDLDANGKQTKFERIHGLLSKILEDDPDDLRAHFHLMKAYGSNSRLNEAITTGERFLKLAKQQNKKLAGTQFQETFYLLAAFYMKGGDFAGARAYIREGIEQDPTYPDLFHLLSRLDNQEGRNQAALDHSLTALELMDRYERGEIRFLCIVHPSRNEILYEIAWAYCELGQYKEALKHCRDAISLRSDRAGLHLLESKILLGLKDVDSAEEALRKAKDLDINMAEYEIKKSPSMSDQKYFKEGLHAFRNKEMGKAATLLGKVLEINPNHPDADAWLSNLYCVQGDLDEAYRHAQRALQLGQREMGLNALAGVKLEQGEIQQAESLTRQCLSEFPDSARTCHNLGRILWKRARRLDALTYYEKAAALDPESARYDSDLKEVKKSIRLQPTISLCMIVKNEEENLVRCLQSVEGVVDEVIVVDTGSDDKTMEIARRHGAQVHEHPWLDDFAGMRNISLGYAQGDWILILDADEELEADDKQTIINEAVDTTVNGMTFVVHNYLENKKRNLKTDSVRMFKNDGKNHYKGIVHNQLVCTPPVKTTPIRVHHYGYDVNDTKKKEKIERIKRLLFELIREDPDDIRAHFHLMTVYGFNNELEKAAEAGERFLHLMVDAGKALENTSYFSVYFLLATFNFQLGNREAARGYAKKGMVSDPGHPDLPFILARIDNREEKWDSAVDHGLKALALYDKYENGETHFLSGVNCSKNEILLEIGHPFFELGEYEKALNYCQQANEVNSGLAKSHLLEAKIQIKLDNYPAAERAFKKAGDIDPEIKRIRDEAMQSSGVNTNASQMIEIVVQSLCNAKKNGKGRAQIPMMDHISSLETSLKQRDTDLDEQKARDALERGHREEGLIGLGMVSRERGDFKQASSFFKKCIEEFPKSARAYMELGKVFTERNRRLDAVSYFEQAVHLEPTNSEYTILFEQIKDDIGSRPTISLCMMVKNEEISLARLLRSVEGSVDEIVVVDTGSVDRTMDIARQFDVHLYRHPWEDDFSGMRNTTITYAGGDWVLILDADEELEETDREKLREVSRDTSVNGFYFDIHNHILNNSRIMIGRGIRLFKNDGQIHYEGIVHNKLMITPPLKDSRIRVRHYGYDLDEQAKQHKYERTVKLLRKELEADPDSLRTHFNFLKSYFFMEDAPQTIQAAEKVIELSKSQNINLAATPYLETYGMAAGACLLIGDLDKAKMFIEQGLEVEASYPDLHHLLSKVYVKEGLLQKAKEHALQAHHYILDNGRDDTRLNCIIHSELCDILYDLAGIYHDLGELNEALEKCEEALTYRPNMVNALLLRAKVLLKLGKKEAAEESLNKAKKIDPDCSRLRIVSAESVTYGDDFFPAGSRCIAKKR